MERLLRKFDTARTLVPQPVVRQASEAVLAKANGRVRFGALQFGSTSPAMSEAHDALEDDGIAIDVMRLRAFPFPECVREFIASHEAVFVVEQNRDAQIRTLLVNELGIDPARLIPVLHYDGTPITARYIHDAISTRIGQSKVTPIKRVA